MSKPKLKFQIVFSHNVAWFRPIDLRTVAWMEAKGAWMIAWIGLAGFAFRPFANRQIG